MEALIHLRQATRDDLIVGTGELVINKVFFALSSISGLMSGPYVIDEDTWFRDIFINVLYKKLYVAHYEATAESTSCTMAFRPAVPGDLKQDGRLKANFSFYLMANEKLNGPLAITEKTNPLDLKQYLDEGRIYVLEHRKMQHFKEINIDRKAS